MKKALCAGIMISALLLAVPVFADDLLGKKGGGGGSGRGGGQSGGSSGGHSGGQKGDDRGGNRGGGGDRGGNRGGGDRGDRGDSRGTVRGSGRVQPGPPSRIQGDRGRRPDGAGSHSGRVSYGSTSNFRRGSDEFYRSSFPSSRNLERDVNGQPGIRRAPGNWDSRDHYRSGYVHYSDRWRDSWFWYPYYSFDYDARRCVPSPFYFYGHLPAYISVGRVTVVYSSPVIIGRCNVRYSYDPLPLDWGSSVSIGWSDDQWDVRATWQNDSVRDRSELDQSVDDISLSFYRGSVRPMSDLLPARDRVLIDVDGDSRYTLSGDDFYDMIKDLVEGTRTVNYRINDVRTERGYATVYATHEYRDSWGDLRRSRHIYGLEESGRGYVIREFSVRRD